jgi:hypothetical protein
MPHATVWFWPTDPEILSDPNDDIKEYLQSVHDCADPDTGLLSFGDTARLLQAHGTTWDEYVRAGGSLGSWPVGSRNPHHVLGFLGY